MSTATAPATIDRDNYLIEYTPFAEKEPIKLSRNIVRRVVAVPTKSGALPTDADIDKFILLNRAKELNPFTGDSFLVGYDSKDGPKFSLITAIQALLKRAEANPAFDGMESGIVVRRGDQIIERPGNLVYPGEQLFGGWARLWRRDRSHAFYDSLLLSAYKPPYQNPQWEKDGPGMIDKCAQASVLRTAFPSQLSALYIAQEMGLLERAAGAVEHVQQTGERVTTIEGLTKQIAGVSKKADAPASGNGNGHREPDEQRGQAEGHEQAAKEAEAEAEGEQHEAEPVDGLKVIRAEFEKAKTEKAIDKVYDSAMGPESSAQWSHEEEKAIEAMRAAAKDRVSAAKGKAKGELFENKPGAVEGGQ